MEERQRDKGLNSLPTKEYVAGEWWLMPIFLGLIGGLVAWLVNKKKEPAKARSMLLVGVGLSVVVAIFGLTRIWEGSDELLVFILAILAGILGLAFWVIMIVVAYIIGKGKKKSWLGLILGIFLGWIGVIIMALLPYPDLIKAPAR